MLIVLAGSAWYYLGANRPATVASSAPIAAAHLSIVVLPFTNLSNDPSQDYFADGITENLTTDLSRIRNSFVIARNTAFTFKGKAADAKEIGKELGVRYVLEGSVQRDQNRVRVNVQLIDAESGAHLWADRFEEDVADLFKLQDQVVARLANSLGYELVKAEAQRGSRANNPDAIDLTMRGRALQSPPVTKDNNIAARAWFEQALKIDANDGDAVAGEAYSYMLEFTYGWTNLDIDYDTRIIDQADRAITIASDNVLAFYVKGTYFYLSNRGVEALAAVDAGIAVNPNFAPLYGSRSGAEASLGRFEQAKFDAQQAMRLSPRDPLLGLLLAHLGDAEVGLGHYDAAIDEYHKAVDSGFHAYFAHSNLAAAYALNGKMEEAKVALAEARRLNHKLTVKWLIAHSPNLPPLFEGLRKAGLPEE